LNDRNEFVPEAEGVYRISRLKTGDHNWKVDYQKKKGSEWTFFYSSDITRKNDTTYREIKHRQPNDEGVATTFILHALPGGYLIKKQWRVISKGFSSQFFPFREDGIWTYYDSLSGSKQEEVVYVKGSLTNENRTYLVTGEVLENVYTFVDQDPAFKEPSESMATFIGANLKYPVDAITTKAQGKVFVTFVVTTEGSVKDVRLLKGFLPSCDNEALRVISATSGKWKPGVKAGKNVNVRLNVPIVYRLK